MLDSLATEFVDHVASFLHDSSDLLSLRLTCRQLYETTLAAFGTAWFGLVNTDFSPRSFRMLSGITRHENLRFSIRTRALGEGNIWPRYESGSLDLSSRIVTDFQDLMSRAVLSVARHSKSQIAWAGILKKEIPELDFRRQMRRTSCCLSFPERTGRMFDRSLRVTSLAILRT